MTRISLAAVDAQHLIQHVIDAASLGSLYALLALGIALIFGIMRLVNFAHGELIMAGAYALVLFADVPLALRIAAAVAVTVVLALAMERVAFRPLRRATPATLLVASFAVSFGLQSLALIVLGAFPRTTNVAGGLAGSFVLGGVSVPRLSVVTVVLTAFLLATLALFLTRTTLGVQMRASAENFWMARALGIRANRVIAAAFAASGLLAAAAAFLLTVQRGAVSSTFGLNAVLIAFVATILGGLGSLVGAVLGGFGVGALTVVLQASLPLELRSYRDAFVFAAVLAVIVFRPQGLVVARSVATRVDAAPAEATVAGGATARGLTARLPSLLVLWAIVGAVSLVALVGSDSVDRTVLNMLVNLTLVVGLYIFVGNSGVFSFGHAAFIAVGAYTAAILTIPVEKKGFLYDAMPDVLRDAHASTIAAILAGGALAAAFAFVVSIPLMRLSGLGAGLATFAVLVIVNDVAKNWSAVTGGLSGLVGVPQSATVGTALVWALVAVTVAFAFQQTRSCLRLRASREDPAAARAVGVRIAHERRISFCLSAFVMGIGGALYAQTLGLVTPDALFLGITFLTLAMLVVGGMNSLSGAVVGAIAVSLLAEILRRLEGGVDVGGIVVDAPSGLRELGFAAVMLAILVLRPSGLVGGRELSLPRIVAGRVGAVRSGRASDATRTPPPDPEPLAQLNRKE